MLLGLNAVKNILCLPLPLKHLPKFYKYTQAYFLIPSAHVPSYIIWKSGSLLTFLLSVLASFSGAPENVVVIF